MNYQFKKCIALCQTQLSCSGRKRSALASLPREITAIIEEDMATISSMLSKGHRQEDDGEARLRPYQVMEKNIRESQCAAGWRPSAIASTTLGDKNPSGTAAAPLGDRCLPAVPARQPTVRGLFEKKRLDASGSARKGSNKAGRDEAQSAHRKVKEEGHANICVAEHANS